MKFLMSDGELKQIDDVVAAEIEDGRLAGRNDLGDIVVSFTREQVIGWDRELAINENQSNRRQVVVRRNNSPG